MSTMELQNDLKGLNATEYAERLLAIYHEVWNAWKDTKEKVDFVNKEQVDLLHKIEGKKGRRKSQKEKAKIYDSIEICRDKRRQLKNELAQLSVLTDFTRETIKNVYNLKNEIEKVEIQQKHWVYKCQTSKEELNYLEVV